MVDWATRDRLYPAGYRTVDVRCRRVSLDSSVPFSVASNKRHSCRSQTKLSKKFRNENLFLDRLQRGLCSAVTFYDKTSDNYKNDRNPKLLATYASNINWPRAVCCLSETDGSIIVCEQERCRLVLFTSRLVLRSTCGGKRGDGRYEFDSPWSVAALFDNSSPYVLVADTNNRRIQFFTIEYNGDFLFRSSLVIKNKPYFIATSKQHIAVSCEGGILEVFLADNQLQVSSIDLNRISKKHSSEVAFCVCMDPDNSFIFVSNPLAPTNTIYQLTVSGEYLRSVKLDSRPFLRVSCLTFDTRNQQIVVADAFNSIIYSVEHDLDEENVEILLKRSDNVNFPQDLCISNEGHLIAVECSVLSQHALKIFRHYPCECHSRLTASSVKTSETTSVRSIIYQY